jgi:hypothetical protein
MGKLKTLFKALFIPLFILFALSSCIKLISEEFPDFETVPCLNSILVAEDSMHIHVSLAEKIDANYLTVVDDAEIQVLLNGNESLELTSLSDGHFVTDDPLEPGAKYSISAIVAGFPEITAEAIVPSPVDVSILEYDLTATINEEGYYRAQVDFRFMDDQSTADYYEIIVYKRRDDYLTSTYPYNEQNEVFLNEGFEPYSTPSLLFSDELIKEEEVNMNLIISSSYSVRGYGSVYWQVFDEHMLIVELRHVSEDYYKFKKSLYFYENSRYADFIEGTAVSYPLYSNIENGLGIFASYASTLDSVFQEEVEIELAK